MFYIFLFVSRYDKDNDGLLQYEDLARALMPFENDFSNMLKLRTSDFNNGKCINLPEVYSEKTLTNLRNYFRVIFDGEN